MTASTRRPGTVPMGERPRLSGNANRVVWVLWTLALTLVFGRIGAYNLGNYRPVSNDEMELMAVAYKLASQGVLGSDLYAGFYGADQHFLITLPLQHIAEAASFKLFGVGVAQMRWVSLVAGVSLVWVVSWLAYRWYGLGTAISADLLLVAWPSNLTSAPNGLPLLGVTRAARYDVLAVAFAWLAIALLYEVLCRPRRAIAFGLGVCCGLATLAQFIGAFVVPLVALNWLWARGRRGLAEPLLYWVVAGAGLVWLPWIVFVAQHHVDWTAQLTVYGGDRWDVLNPSFYVANLFSEASRYQDVLRGAVTEDPSSPNSPVSQLLMAIAVWPAVAYLVWRSRRTHAIGDRVLWSGLVIFSGLLLVVDQTKTPLYAIILLPSLCLAVAVLSTALWRRERATPPLARLLPSSGIPVSTTPSGKVIHGSTTPSARGIAGSTTSSRLMTRVGCVRLISRVVLVGLGLFIAKDGIAAYQVYLTQASLVSQYLGVGVELDEALDPGAHILGPERWWWALHNHQYRSLRSVWWQWWAAGSQGQTKGQLPQFATWVASTQTDAIIVNDNIRDDILSFPDPLQQQFWAFVSMCTTPALDLTDASYLRIEVDRITRPPPELEICGGGP